MATPPPPAPPVPPASSQAPAAPPPVDWSARSDAEVAESFAAAARAARTARRAAVRAAGLGARGDDDPVLGLALSGGGIRSATISLGVAQGLARAGHLLDFDYCSTVSGGGYCGSFLGGLFLPDDPRGNTPDSQQPRASDDDNPVSKAHFALDALTSDPERTVTHFPIPPGGTVAKKEEEVRNPVWWLRDYSRYLAPEGPSDYLTAATVIARNWLAMIYVFMLPVAALVLALIAANWGLGRAIALWGPGWLAGLRIPVGARAFDQGLCLQLTGLAGLPAPLCAGWLEQLRAGAGLVPVDPGFLFLLVALGLFALLVLALAFWNTAYMSAGGPGGRDEMLVTRWSSAWRMALAGGLWLAALLVFAWVVFTMVWPGAPDRFTGPFRFAAAMVELLLSLAGWSDGAVSLPFDRTILVIAVGFVASALGILTCGLAHVASYGSWEEGNSPDAFTAEVRRRITRWASRLAAYVLIGLALAVLDTLARWLYLAWSGAMWGGHGAMVVSWSLIAPAVAFLYNKLPGWFADKRIVQLLGRHVWTIALIASTACYAVLFLAVHVGLQHAIFQNTDWSPRSSAALPSAGARYLAVLALVGVQLLLVGKSTSFINISTLHAFYASRLTRAYLGAGNLRRLRSVQTAQASTPSGSNTIVDSDPGDQIDVAAYQECFAAGRNLAPMHLINVTLNETVPPDGARLIERDRKGFPVCFAPEGLLVDAGKGLCDRAFHPWGRARVAERLSVGQLCAISGAAVSSGMGARTRLGGSLALTFANLRLGYWWSHNDLLTRKEGQPPRPGLAATISPFVTYQYLGREMLGLFRRSTRRVNISDGGHFENSGAYELLRRRADVILVSDNGEDAQFLFEDLEILMRKARLDLGIDLRVLSRAETRSRLKGSFTVSEEEVPGTELFLNCGTLDWRCRAAATNRSCASAVPHDPAFCLMLEATAIDAGVPYRGTLVWMKPRLFEGLGHDVAGFATQHPKFPHESTGDQFFDEAQWESYRKLGQSMIERLVASPQGGLCSFLSRLPATGAQGDPDHDGHGHCCHHAVDHRTMTRDDELPAAVGAVASAPAP